VLLSGDFKSSRQKDRGYCQGGVAFGRAREKLCTLFYTRRILKVGRRRRHPLTVEGRRRAIASIRKKTGVGAGRGSANAMRSRGARNPTHTRRNFKVLRRRSGGWRTGARNSAKSRHCRFMPSCRGRAISRTVSRRGNTGREHHSGRPAARSASPSDSASGGVQSTPAKILL
jgi:hypothetical protein